NVTEDSRETVEYRRYTGTTPINEGECVKLEKEDIETYFKALKGDVINKLNSAEENEKYVAWYFAKYKSEPKLWPGSFVVFDKNNADAMVNLIFNINLKMKDIYDILVKVGLVNILEWCSSREDSSSLLVVIPIYVKSILQEIDKYVKLPDLPDYKGFIDKIFQSKKFEELIVLEDILEKDFEPSSIPIHIQPYPYIIGVSNGQTLVNIRIYPMLQEYFFEKKNKLLGKVPATVDKLLEDMYEKYYPSINVHKKQEFDEIYVMEIKLVDNNPYKCDSLIICAPWLTPKQIKELDIGRMKNVILITQFMETPFFLYIYSTYVGDIKNSANNWTIIDITHQDIVEHKIKERTKIGDDFVENFKRLYDGGEQKIDATGVKRNNHVETKDTGEGEKVTEQIKKKETSKDNVVINREEGKNEQITQERDKKTAEKEIEEKVISEEIKKEIEALNNKGFYFTNSNWKVFYLFINETKKKLDIITNRLSFETFSFLFGKNKLSSTVKIRIIVGHTPRNYDKIKRFVATYGLDLELYVCKRIHCKFCIRDEDTILLGSSNMVFNSLGNIKREGNFEADIIYDYEPDVKEASNLFETIWQEKEKYVPLHGSSRFLSSISGIPSKIEELISKTEGELIIFSPNFADTELIGAIRMINENIKIKIVLNWPDKASENNKKALNLIRDAKSADGTEALFSIIPRRESIHAKIYVFDKKIAFISSLNLTQSSWGYMIETGLLIDDKEIIESIMKMIKTFHYKIPSAIKIKEGGGDEETLEITEFPDEKFLFLESEGKTLLKKYGQLYDKFRKEYGEAFPESIPEEPEDVKPSSKEVIPEPASVKPPSKVVIPDIPEKLIDSAIKQKTSIVISDRGGWTLGKGFSKEEIKKTNVKNKILQPLNIHTDSRRRTCHEHNIKLIKKIIS
ncbi:MAG: phospholipase D-like domain-containing protein, partial [Candidatus Thermoplasmatota archaeon]|nr:phospholipase D-like domain-containing protein [Candidatus Thermoplasmatota archaeon]